MSGIAEGLYEERRRETPGVYGVKEQRHAGIE
jgi:hypothetical protein